jgi:hypothetical protein
MSTKRFSSHNDKIKLKFRSLLECLLGEECGEES